MSMNAPLRVVRSLERLDLENRWRGPDDDRSDLLDLAREARADAELLDVPDLVAAAYTRTAEIHLALGDVELALVALDTASVALRGLREQDLKVRILALRAECQARKGDWPAVNTTCGDGIAIVERFRYRVSPTYLKSTYLRSRIGLYSLGVRAAAETGDIETMLERAELSKCRGLIGTSPKQTGELDKLNRAELVERFQNVNEKIERGLKRGEQSPGLLAERRILWDLISIATERGRARHALAEPFRFDRAQACLADKQAVIYYYWVDRHQLLSLVFDRHNVAFEIKSIGESERSELDDLARALLEIEPGSPMSLVDCVQDFEDLLWPSDPAAHAILEKADRLILSPHLGLHALPIHTLAVDGADRIRRFAVRLAPNLTSLMLDGPSGAPDQSLLALGIKDYHIPGMVWPALPDAEDEVIELEELYRANRLRATALFGAAANEDELNAMSADGRLKSARRLHFACHGMNIDGDTPMESGLCLSDSELDGVEISLMDMEADLVVLSACCSGQRAISGRGMAELPGDELFGLQAAFFTAGAKEIVASLWPVDSKAARVICVNLHRHLIAGLPSDVALQRSICDYLDAAGLLRRRRFFWGPFQLMAVGRSLPVPKVSDRSTL